MQSSLNSDGSSQSVSQNSDVKIKDAKIDPNNSQSSEDVKPQMPYIALKTKQNLRKNRHSESADSVSSNNSNKTVQSIMFSQYKKRANDDTSQTPKA